MIHLSFASFKAAIGVDKRILIEEPLQTEFQAIGLFISEEDENFLCTATLIHKKYVLTAAHCLTFFDSPDALKRIKRFGFWPGFNLKSYKKSQSVKNIFSESPIKLKLFRKGKYSSYCETEIVSPAMNDLCTKEDWAILQIIDGHSNEITPLPLLQFPLTLKKQKLLVPQYSRDRWIKFINDKGRLDWSPMMSLEPKCEIRDFKFDGILHTNCSLSDVGSGSPLLVRIEKKLYVIGVASLGIDSYSSTPGDVVIVEKYIKGKFDTVFNDLRMIRIPKR